MENQSPATGSGQPREKERTTEQLASIHAAMMEELGVGRKDTLPLEDRGYSDHVLLIKPNQPKVPTNAEVAQWHNIEFDDVDEATEQLDNIADGQLYRLRRGASFGPSHAPSGRGGHSSSNTFRDGRGGTAARGSPGKSGRGGRTSGSTRGGRVASFRSARLTAMSLSSTPAISFNDARRGISNHARIEKAIAILKGTPRTAAPSNENPPETSSKPSHYSGLVSPEDFVSAMGLKARAGNVPTPVSTSQLEFKLTPLASQLKSSIIGGALGINRPSTPAFANRSTGLTASRWATAPPAVASSARPSCSISSVSTPDASFASTPALTALTPKPVVSTPAAAIPILGPVLNASSQLNHSAASAVSPLVAPPVRPHSSASNSTVNAPETVVKSTAPAARPIPSPQTPVSTALAVLNLATRAARLDASSPNLSGSATILSCRSVLIEKPVKANKNGGVDQPAKARLKSLESITLELEVGNLVQLHLPLSGSVSFCSTTSTTISFFVEPDIYHVTFRFPHEVSAFEQFLPAQLKKASDQFLDKEAPTAGSRPALSVSEDENDSSVPVVAVSRSATDVSTETNHSVAPAIEVPPAVAVAGPVLKVQEHMGDSSVATFDTSTALARPVVNVSENVDNSPLIDFSEDVLEDFPLPQGRSALEDLVFLDKDPLIVGILNQLNGVAGGSFLNYNSGVSAEALLAKVESHVGAYLRTSIFRHLPEDVRAVYTKETSRGVIEAAKEALESKATEPGTVPKAENDPSHFGAVIHLNGKAPTSDNYDSDQMNDPQQAHEPQGVKDSYQVNSHQKMRKYSVQMLFAFRGDAPTVKEDLISRTEELKIDGKLSKLTARTPSQVEIACKFASKPYQAAFHGQGSWDLKPSHSKVATGRSTPQEAQKLPAVTTEAPTSNKQSEYAKADPTLYVSSIGQRKLTQVQPKGNHHFAASKDLARLTSAFSDLKIIAASQPPGVVVPSPNLYVGQDVQNQLTSKPAKSVVSAASAEFSNQYKTILETSNRVEDMARAKVAGLSTSKWSQLSPLPLFPAPLQAPQMQAITGLEVIGTIPVVAHQQASPPRCQENLGSQSFPPRPDMHEHRTSNASSTVSDFKPESQHTPTSPPGSSRPPLSPHKANIRKSLRKTPSKP